jgi:hypothetical protein
LHPQLRVRQAEAGDIILLSGPQYPDRGQGW